MKLSGIYCITNTETGKQYIGSSVDIQKRFVAHLCYLRKGNHHSQKLQRAWDKYGESSFRFHVVDYCDDPSELIICEQQWMDSTKPEYNIDLVAGKRAIGFRLTEETRRKLSIAAKSRSSNSNLDRTGKKHTEEAKAKMAAAKRGTTRVFTADHRAKLSEARKRVCHKA